MNELIKIENRDGKETCNARELHTFLKSKQDFSNWIKNRVNKYGFIENNDYIKIEGLSTINLSSSKARPQKTIEYHLTIEMAKELSMVENNAKGREARKYFIACENKLKLKQIPDFNNPAIAARAWADEYEKRQIAENTVEEKNGFIQDLTKERLFSVKQLANYLSFKDVGRNKLFEILRDRKIINDNNSPYQKHITAGHCSVRVVKKGNRSYDQVVFTVNGMEYVRKGLLKLGYIQDENFKGDDK